jgi:hypothetical protein
VRRTVLLESDGSGHGHEPGQEERPDRHHEHAEADRELRAHSSQPCERNRQGVGSIRSSRTCGSERRPSRIRLECGGKWSVRNGGEKGKEKQACERREKVVVKARPVRTSASAGWVPYSGPCCSRCAFDAVDRLLVVMLNGGGCEADA